MELTASRRRALVIALVAAVVLVLVSALVLRPDDDKADAVASPDTTTSVAPTTAATATTPSTTAVDAAPAERATPIGHPYAPAGGAGSGNPGGGSIGLPPVGVPVPVLSHIAEAVGPEVQVQSAPDGPGIAMLPATTEFGSKLTFLVYGRIPGWVEVWLPTRPNGSRGWVREEAVRVTSTPYAIGIDLAARRLTLFNAGAPMMTTDVAIGTPSAPTPTGLHYVTDLLSTPSPGGAYGPYAFGLSSHSDVYSEFAGGDGQIGMHGTNQPGLMGQAVSHGCVRMPNEFVSQLVGLLPLGTPVQVS